MPRKKKSSTKRRKGRAAEKGQSGRPATLSKVTTPELRREINRRERMIESLMVRRNNLAAQLSAVEAEIARNIPNGRRGLLKRAQNGGKLSGGPIFSSRPHNAQNLVDSLRDVLKGKTMGVAQVADAVQEAGYATTSPNFRTIVNAALINNRRAFKKVRRGKYTAR